jgi:hypothetical protein
VHCCSLIRGQAELPCSDCNHPHHVLAGLNLAADQAQSYVESPPSVTVGVQLLGQAPAGNWQRSRHWFAPPLHAMLQGVLTWASAGGARLADFAAALPSTATAFLRDHQVCCRSSRVNVLMRDSSE